MPSCFVSSPADDGPARSAIISRSSERRSNKCITESARSPYFWDLADSNTLAREHSRGNRISASRATISFARARENMVRQEAMLADAPQTGAPRVAQEPLERHAAAQRRAHRCLAVVPVDAHHAPARGERAGDAT